MRLSGQQIEILGADGREPASDRACDADAVVVLRYAERPTPQSQIEKLNPIWIDLLKLSDADTARRLRGNFVFQQDPRRLTVQLEEGGGGFTVTIEQLLRNKAFWIPSLDLYLAVGELPLPLAQAPQGAGGVPGPPRLRPGTRRARGQLRAVQGPYGKTWAARRTSGHRSRRPATSSV